jgi:hypothetical protein
MVLVRLARIKFLKSIMRILIWRKTFYPSTENTSGLSASWIGSGGNKSQFYNVFMGFSLRLNQLVTNKKPNNFDNLYIPFNRTYNGSFE